MARGRGEVDQTAEHSRVISGGAFLAQMHERLPLTLSSLQHVVGHAPMTLQMVENRLQEWPRDNEYKPNVLEPALKALAQAGEIDVVTLRVCKRCGGAESIRPHGETWRCDDCRIIFGYQGEYEVNGHRYLGTDRDGLAVGGEAYQRKAKKPQVGQYRAFADEILRKLWYERHSTPARQVDDFNYLRSRTDAEGADTTQMVAELVDAGLLEATPNLRCKYCKTRTLKDRRFNRDPEQGIYEEDPILTHCTRCHRIQATEGIYAPPSWKQSDDFIEQDGFAYQLTNKAAQQMQEIEQLGKEIEAENDEAALKAGSVDIIKIGRALSRRFDKTEDAWAAKSGSPSRFWTMARENGWVTEAQMDAARKHHIGLSWNSTGAAPY